MIHTWCHERGWRRPEASCFDTSVGGCCKFSMTFGSLSDDGNDLFPRGWLHQAMLHDDVQILSSVLFNQFGFLDTIFS
jgi:hypothetical protein